jgi:hypothetical protein
MFLAHSITKYHHHFEHCLMFEFGGKIFETLVVDSNDETYVSECLLLEKAQQPLEIEIPTYFGGFAPDIYKLLYARVHETVDEKDNDADEQRKN